MSTLGKSDDRLWVLTSLLYRKIIDAFFTEFRCNNHMMTQKTYSLILQPRIELGFAADWIKASLGT